MKSIIKAMVKVNEQLLFPGSERYYLLRKRMWRVAYFTRNGVVQKDQSSQSSRWSRKVFQNLNVLQQNLESIILSPLQNVSWPRLTELAESDRLQSARTELVVQGTIEQDVIRAPRILLCYVGQLPCSNYTVLNPGIDDHRSSVCYTCSRCALILSLNCADQY